MPRQRATRSSPQVSTNAYINGTPVEKSYFTFVAGLNTDASPLAFPDNFSSDEENFVLNIDGSRQRRKGLALETGGAAIELSEAVDGVVRAHHWRNVAGDPSLNMLVLQAGKYLFFFEDMLVISSVAQAVGAIDLTTHKVATATEQQVEESYVNTDYGRGHFFVVGKYIEPLLVKYENSIFSAEEISIEERDFEGILDGISTTTQPTTEIQSHIYNLKNAGWTGTFIADYFTDQSKYPAKNMIPWMGLAGQTTSNVAEKDWTKAFSPAKLLGELFQDAPAPTGHFIRNIFDTTFVIEGDGPSFEISTWRLDSETGGDTTLHVRLSSDHTLVTNDPVAIDGNIAVYERQVFSGAGRNLFGEIGIWETWSADDYYTDITVPVLTISDATEANPIEITTTVAHTLITGDRVKFAALPGDFGTNLNGNTYPITKTSDTKFTVAVNGSGYGAYTSGGTATAANCFSVPVTTPAIYPYGFRDQYRQLGTVWTEYEESTAPEVYNRRPTAVGFYAGRLWFAGVQTSKMSHRLYFSQVVENDSQYGKCYQVADPTSELISDLVPTDGGVIVIPEIDTVKEIIHYNGKLLVFADNGVWEVGGGERGYFTATGYSVRQISSAGCTSAASVIVADGTPYYLGDNAIYSIQQDPNLGFLYTQDMTTGRIQKLLGTINKQQKELVQSSYDRNSKKIYWLYNTSNTIDWKFPNWLVLDLRINSFSKFSNKGSLSLRTIYDIEEYQAETDEERNIKFICDNTARDEITIAELNDETFEDFGTDAAAYTETGNDGVVDITKRRYGRHLFTYMKRTETGYTGQTEPQETDPSECYVRYLWNWADSSTTGAWSVPRSVYRRWSRKYRNPLVDGTGTDLMGEPIVVAKSKIRGSGKVLRLRFDTEAGKDCHLYGWHLRQDIGAEA